MSKRQEAFLSSSFSSVVARIDGSFMLPTILWRSLFGFPVAAVAGTGGAVDLCFCCKI